MCKNVFVSVFNCNYLNWNFLANIGFCEVFLQCPLATAIQRNSSRGYQIPEQKIRMMMSSMEFPNPEKYKWEKYSVMFDSSVDLQDSSL